MCIRDMWILPTAMGTAAGLYLAARSADRRREWYFKATASWSAQQRYNRLTARCFWECRAIRYRYEPSRYWAVRAGCAAGRARAPAGFSFEGAEENAANEEELAARFHADGNDDRHEHTGGRNSG